MIDHLLGGMAALTGFVSSGVGVCAQIHLNWKRRSTAGLSRVRHIAQFASFSSGAIYAIAVLGDPYVTLTMTLGTVTLGTVLVQMWIYR